MPFQLDDLDFMQEATKEGMKGLLHEFARQNSGNVVLSGCQVSPNASNFDISEGYVMLDYEVLYFAGVTNITSDQPYFELEVTYDPAGNDVFFDNVTRDTYEVRQAKINLSVPAGSNVRLLDSNRLVYFMKLALQEPNVLWGEAYMDSGTELLDLTKDVNGTPFADPEKNYSKKYIFVKTTGVQTIRTIVPYPDSGVPREYVILSSSGTLRFVSTTSGGTFIQNPLASGFVQIAQNQSIKITSGKGVFFGGTTLPFWRVGYGGSATLNAINVFKRTQREAKDSVGFNTNSPKAIQLSGEGNTFEVDTSGQREVEFMLSLGVGTKVHIIANGQPFLFKHNTGSPPANYKPIIVPDGKDLDCFSTDSTVSLIEGDTHWRMQGAEKKVDWVTLPYTSITGANIVLSFGEVKYFVLGDGRIHLTFNLSGTAASPNPTFVGFVTGAINILGNSWATCAIEGSSLGGMAGKLYGEPAPDRITIVKADGSPFSSNETLSIMGEIILNANLY